MKNDDDGQMASTIAHYEDAEQADAVFIDQAYGTGIYSFGKRMNRRWILINFGTKSSVPGFANKRAQMWGAMKQWLIDGGCIPDIPEMIADLTGPESQPNIRDEIQLESKKSMKSRGLASPGNGDALGLTFAMPVKKKNSYSQQGEEGDKEFAKSEYDVLAA